MQHNLDLIRALEEELFKQSVRGSPEAVSNLLAESFVEFVRSSRMYEKEDAWPQGSKPFNRFGAANVTVVAWILHIYDAVRIEESLEIKGSAALFQISVGTELPEDFDQCCRQPGPSGLMTGADAGPVVAVKILVEQ